MTEKMLHVILTSQSRSTRILSEQILSLKMNFKLLLKMKFIHWRGPSAFSSMLAWVRLGYGVFLHAILYGLN